MCCVTRASATRANWLAPGYVSRLQDTMTRFTISSCSTHWLILQRPVVPLRRPMRFYGPFSNEGVSHGRSSLVCGIAVAAKDCELIFWDAGVRRLKNPWRFSVSRIISIARALSLRTLLFALVGAMGVMLTVTLARNATSSWRAGALATLTSQSNATADLLLSAAAHWAVERGITNGVLSAEPPLKAEVRSQIDERRMKADAALTEAAARLEDDKSPAVQALLREADGVLRDIDQLRRRVDAEVSKPRSERDAKLLAEWFPAMTKVIEVSQRLRLAAEINSESVETHLQTLQQLKHLAWVMAEYAGRERGMLNGTIQAGAPLRGEQLVALGVARGNVE